MNTDKIYAEAIANEYAPKDTSKVIALKKLDRKAKGKANIFAYTFGVMMALVLGVGMCLFHESNRGWKHIYDDCRYYYRHYWYRGR